MNESINEDVADAAFYLRGLEAPMLPYLDAIAPGETDAMRRDMMRMSGCGLIVAGAWRSAGIKHKLLDPPYHLGTAISRLLDIARECDAWVPWAKRGDGIPMTGDMVYIGNGGPLDHVYTAIDIDDLIRPDGVAPYWRIMSVDGGQKTGAGNQCVRQKTHQIDRDGKDLSMEGLKRDVYGWIQVVKLGALRT